MRELDTLYELCEAVNYKLEECSEKIRRDNGRLEMKDVEYLDALTHTLKSLKTTIAMIEAQSRGYSGHYWDGRYYYDGETSMDGSSNRSFEGSSNGRRMERDRMGHFSERGYSREDAKTEFNAELEKLMNKAPNEQTKKKLERMMNE